MPIELWFFIVAIVYTYFGYRMGKRGGVEHAIEITVDNLIRDGYLFVRKTPAGEDELVKINEIINQKNIMCDKENL